MIIFLGILFSFVIPACIVGIILCIYNNDWLTMAGLIVALVTTFAIFITKKRDKGYKENITNEELTKINELFLKGVNIPDKPNYKMVYEPWYLSTIFIAILFGLWFLRFIPLAYGVILLGIKYYKKGRLHYELGSTSDRLSKLYHNTINVCTDMINSTYNQKQKFEGEIEKIEIDENNIRNKIVENRNLLNAIIKQQGEAKQYLNELLEEIKEASVELMGYDTVSIQPIDEEIEAETYKTKAETIRAEYKELMKQPNCGIIVGHLAIKKGKILENNIKKMLKIYNTDCDNAIRSVSTYNFEAKRKAINRAFEQVNKFFENDKLSLSTDFLKLKLEELDNIYAYKKKVEIEKEREKEIRERLYDEGKAREQINEKRSQIEKELGKYENRLKHLKSMLNKTFDEAGIKLYKEDIENVEQKIAELKNSLEDIENWASKITSGYVYVISNIGSFGENIYKIGVTRRYDPMERIEELSSASVPFGFDVHAMIFSDDAFKLETALHRYFADKKVNKVSRQKEFFRVSLDEIKEVVHKNFSGTAEFVDYAKAEQYRKTLEIEKAQKNK